MVLRHRIPARNFEKRINTRLIFPCHVEASQRCRSGAEAADGVVLSKWDQRSDGGAKSERMP